MNTETEIRLGKTYYVVLPITDTNEPDDHAIAGALGLPDGALEFEVSLLDGKRVTVIETGHVTDGLERAALVRHGKVKWDRPVQITLTPDQQADLGAENFTPGVTYQISGTVWPLDEDGEVSISGPVEFPSQRTYVIPEAWLAPKYPQRAHPSPHPR